MPLAPDTLTWDGLVIGSLGDDVYLAEGVSGFGHGMHNLPRVDRLGGGQAFGRSAKGALSLTVDAWGTTDQLGALREAMDARPDPADVLPLSWRGLGWDPTHELTVWAKPLGFDFDVDEGAMPDLDEVGVIDGIRCLWVAGDPTVYGSATAFTQASPSSLITWTYTNPGDATPQPGLGGRAWTVAVTAATTTVRPYVECGSRRVTFRDLTLSPGQTLTIGPDRIPMVGTATAVGYSGSPAAPSPDWPILDAGVERQFKIGAQSGTFTATGSFRGTW